MDKIVITLTTVPQRLSFEPEDGFKLCLKSLCEQNHDSYEVHLNLPHKYNVTGEEYVIPQWIEDYQSRYPHLKVFRMEDMGPPTKVVPTIQRETPNTLLIVADDDLVYHPEEILGFLLLVKFQELKNFNITNLVLILLGILSKISLQIS